MKKIKPILDFLYKLENMSIKELHALLEETYDELKRHDELNLSQESRLFYINQRDAIMFEIELRQLDPELPDSKV